MSNKQRPYPCICCAGNGVILVLDHAYYSTPPDTPPLSYMAAKTCSRCNGTGVDPERVWPDPWPVDHLLRFVEAAVVRGLIRSGSHSMPFTIQQKDDGSLVIEMAEPLTRAAGLEIWGQVQIATKRDDLLVIDGDGFPWSRLLEARP